MFEWQRHTQSQGEIPHYQEILKFLDFRAQASDISMPLKKQSTRSDNRSKGTFPNSKTVPSYAINLDSSNSQCLLCKTEKHPLYSCPKFKSLPHDKKISFVKVNNLCMNCLGKGHFVTDCKSLYRCKKCQNPHHTALHVDTFRRHRFSSSDSSTTLPTHDEVSANTAIKLKSSSLLMTCRVHIVSPNGSSIEARALLDSSSSASFVSERLAQTLQLKRSKQRIFVSGIGGISPQEPVQAVTSFKILPSNSTESTCMFEVTALVVPRVTCDLPTCPVPFSPSWSHLIDLPLADPEFGTQVRVDVLLGVDIFTSILQNGRRKGPPGSPIAMETSLGWVLCGSATSICRSPTVTTCHASAETGDDLLRKFWEIEEPPTLNHFSIDENTVVNHFKTNHVRKQNGRFLVPLPKRADDRTIGESRSQAVRRFLSLECTLNNKNRFKELDSVIQEYFDMEHAEVVPPEDSTKPVSDVFYLPIHAVYKQSNTTTKVRAVFDASAKSSSGVSLNDLLLVGPTIHPPLIDVLLRFRLHRITLTADVSKMYRNVELTDQDKDLHRFLWRAKNTEPLRDYRMTRVTFGVSESSFAANMSVRQNAIDLSCDYLLAAKVVEDSIYVDDCLAGADDIEGAIMLYQQLRDLFQCGGFPLRKWNSSDSVVLRRINPSVRDLHDVLTLSDSVEYTKALGIEWNTKEDHFR